MECRKRDSHEKRLGFIATNIKMLTLCPVMPALIKPKLSCFHCKWYKNAALRCMQGDVCFKNPDFNYIKL